MFISAQMVGAAWSPNSGLWMMAGASIEHISSWAPAEVTRHQPGPLRFRDRQNRQQEDDAVLGQWGAHRRPEQIPAFQRAERVDSAELARQQELIRHIGGRSRTADPDLVLIGPDTDVVPMGKDPSVRLLVQGLRAKRGAQEEGFEAGREHDFYISLSVLTLT
jgi:hypothetical protein